MRKSIALNGIITAAKKVTIALGLARPARQLFKALRAKGWTPWHPLVPEEAFSRSVANAISKLRELEPAEPFGDYLEFGVSRGTSMACVFENLERAGLNEARLIGFDSFEGMPPESADQGWSSGSFHSTIDATRDYLRRRKVDLDRVKLVKGWFHDTLTDKTRQELALGRASLIMVDCDIYTSSVEALTFCEPHIRGRAVLIFDDWGSTMEKNIIGQKEAFEAFLVEHPDLTAKNLEAYSPQSRVFIVQRSGA